MVGGNFTVTSAPGKGTTVLARIPLNDRMPRGEREREREDPPIAFARTKL
jgi:hypothetical protein